MNNTKSNKMLIDATHPEETRVVVLRNGRIEEFDWESSARKLLRGNIYLAKVTRVEPSLQAAFVDYGGNRHGFLAFSEIHPDYYQIPMADRQALLAEEAEAEEAKAQAEAAEDAALPEGDSSEEADGSRRERQDHDRDRFARSRSHDDEPRRDNDPASPSMSAGDRAEEQPSVRDAAPLSAPVDRIAEERTDERAPSPYAEPHYSETAGFDNQSGHASAPQAPAPADAGFGRYSGRDEPVRDRDGGSDESAETGSRVIEVIEPEGSGATEVETVGSEDAGEEIPDRPRRFARQYKIQEVIRRRQIILVQVVKEERGNKGAALTTYLSLAGRYTVLMPNTARGGGISRKIANSTDRKRLRKIVTELEVPKGMGLIVRTAGASRTKAEIKRDFEYLLRLWESVRDLTLRSTAPALVYEEGDLIKRSIRDLYSKEIDEIVVAGDQAHANARDFMQMLMPSHVGNVIPFRSPEPLFTKYQIERQLNAMFSPFVTLRSGGYIVINQTEALVSVDVNSGKATREHSIEDTALKTNMEASEEVARQLKLRDLAGLIVIDYIDMEEKRNNRAVERRLKECLRHDRARIQVGRISHFGLLEMSRQRLRPGVLEGSTSQCPHCQGTGTIRSTESVALGVLRGIEDKMISGERYNVIAQTTSDVALYILNQKRHFLNDMESRYGVTITVMASDKVHGANFVIERGPVSEERQPVRRTDVVQMDASHHGPTGSLEADAADEDVLDDERADSADDAGPEEVGADEVRGEAGGDGERRGRKRRRRRRGGRNGADAQAPGGSDGSGQEDHGHDDRDRGEHGRLAGALDDQVADDERGQRSSHRHDFVEGEAGVQEIDTDSEIETIGGDGGGDSESDDRNRDGNDADAGDGSPNGAQAEGDHNGESRRRRRGRRGGRRGGRDRDQRDGEPAAIYADHRVAVGTTPDELPIARPDDWLHSQPTVGDLAAEERRRTGREEQPAYFTRHQDESSQRPGHELERPVWQHAGQRPAGGAYPQVMTGAAAVVSVADPGGRSSSDSSDAAMPDRTDEAATPPVWARGRVEVAPPSAPATDVRPIEPATVPASSKSWTPDSVGEIHHEAHATGFGSYSADGVPAPVELAPVAMIEPAAQPEPQPEPKATEPPRPRRSGWWSRKDGE